MLDIAILASGNGSNAQRIFDMAAAGKLDVAIRLVISNRPDAKVVERARAAGLPVLALDHKNFAGREQFDAAMIDAIHAAGATHIVLAGYMRMLTAAFISTFRDRILNIHPSLLPSFAGLKGVDDATEYGVRISGCTVHFVDEIMDNGAIVIQAAIPHLTDETEDELLERTHIAEHRIYPQAIQWWSQGRLRIEGRHVRLLPPAGPLALAVPPADTLIYPPLEEGF